MRHKWVLVLGVVLVVGLVLYAISFRVRFDQMAVVSTFGNVQSVINAEGEGSGDVTYHPSAGLYWKWPPPIQRLRLYDKRTQISNTELTQRSTKDNQSVIVQAYMSWRIRDPYRFYTRLGNEEDAENLLETELASQAQAAIGRYRFAQLVNTNPEQRKLDEAEQQIEKGLRQRIRKQRYGVAVEKVGIKRILLPESVTKNVYAVMRATRQRLAQSAQSKGKARAAQIKAEAKSAKERILAFAKRRAGAIRAKGDRAAAQYYDVFQKNPQFASFLFKLNTLEKTLRNNTTFLIDAKHGPFKVLEQAPGKLLPAKTAEAGSKQE